MSLTSPSPIELTTALPAGASSLLARAPVILTGDRPTGPLHLQPLQLTVGGLPATILHGLGWLQIKQPKFGPNSIWHLLW